MGVNAQIEVPAFTAGQVLTAAEMTQINTGIPVFATTTTRDAAFGGTGEKVLAEGQMAYIEATNATQYYDGAAWQAVGASGLVRVGGGTLSGASTTFSSVFSATYQAYLVTFTNVLATVGDDFNLQLGATSTGYYWGGAGVPPSGAGTNLQGSNVSGFRVSSTGSTKYTGGNLWLWNPFLSVETAYQTVRINPDTTGNMAPIQGFLNNQTSYTAFTMLMNTGSFTAGTVNIYGLALS
jgi:hypothetical protein